MSGKRSNPVLFLLISLFSFSSAELQLQTLFISDQDAASALYQTAASIPDSENFLWSEMIHRDAHPTFAANNANLSRREIMKSRLERDQMRVASLSNRVSQHPSSTANTPVISGTYISNYSGEYFTRLGVGTPAQDFYMVPDTGSDLTWLQCEDCTNCYDQTDPIFNPYQSTTYQNISCGSETCKLLDYLRADCNLGICQYYETYGDSSFSKGDFVNETLTLGKNSVAGITLGCGHDNQGTFVAAAGVLGLGRMEMSFPNQLGGLQYRRQFAYCLVSRGSSNTSIITFGQAPLSSEARFTPMITGQGSDTFYYVNLTRISVGGSDVKGVDSSISNILPDSTGGVIIDSGTTITKLKRSAYNATRDAFRKAAEQLNLKRAPDFKDFFDTCYDFSGRVENKVSVPTVVLHFTGADMELRADNCLVQVDDYGTFCFAFQPSTLGISIIGNIQQQGFGIMFDLETNIIGITPESC